MTGLLSTVLKPMLPRDTEENHRVATTLELLFDLIFVVAIAAAGQQLHHALVEGQLLQHLPLYLMVFFALWWAWMNFSWFASAYDNDDVLYRIMTMFQMIGALVISAGIPIAFQKSNFDVIIIGYVIMRSVLIVQWLRAAKHDPKRKPTIYRYVIGIALTQMGWLFFHFTPINFSVYVFVLLALAELSVPFIAELKGRTPWHPEHIVERYSLLTIIVLGESIVASFAAISDAFKNHSLNLELVFLTLGGVMLMFSIWWMYFDRKIEDRLNTQRQIFTWGYGHFFIFIAIASLGAALAAAVNIATGDSDISNRYDGCVIAVTLIVYSFTLWLLYDYPRLTGIGQWFYPVSAVVLLLIPFLIQSIGYCVFAMAIVFGLRLVLSKWLFKHVYAANA